MSPRLIRQDQAYDRLAKKYGLATSKQLRAGPARYHWDLIERDIKALLFAAARFAQWLQGHLSQVFSQLRSIYVSDMLYA
jgi:hypothetical protein